MRIKQFASRHKAILKELKERDDEFDIKKAEELLNDIKKAGRIILEPGKRNILSNHARNLSEVIFEKTDFFPSFRLDPPQLVSDKDIYSTCISDSSTYVGDSNFIDEYKAKITEEIKTYYKKIESLFKTIPFIGFKTRLRVPINIKYIYIPLRTIIDNRDTGQMVFGNSEEAKECLNKYGESKDFYLLHVFHETEKLKRKGIVILGDPGSGKTTHLKYLFLRCLRKGAETFGLPEGMIPVFLALKDLKNPEASLGDFIQNQINKRHLKAPEGFGKKILKRGNLLFLFDGLDEVADPEQRMKVSRWIEEALYLYPDCRFVVTCRFAGYKDKIILNPYFLEMYVQPFNEQEIEDFICKWYKKIVEKSIADKEANKLITLLKLYEFQARSPLELTKNPLLLTIFCLVHRDRENFSKRRARLYEECTNTLLNSIEFQTKFNVQAIRKILQSVALWLHQKENRTKATVSELAKIIEPALKKTDLKFEKPEDFLRAVHEESGLLTGWGQEYYGYIYLDFQKYFAAREIGSLVYNKPELLHELAGHFGEGWWQEVILIFLALEGLSYFDDFMKKVVELPVFTKNLSLVEMCMEQAHEKSIRPFTDLVKQPPGNEQNLWERQFAALKIIARFDKPAIKKLNSNIKNHPYDKIQQWLLKTDSQDVFYAKPGGYELVKIPAGSFMMGSTENSGEQPIHKVSLSEFYMGRYPVTNKEYINFLLSNPDASEPEYWNLEWFHQLDQPVVGISWHDAEKYAEWAGLKLPTEAQWEYACRAGTDTKYYSGDSEVDLDRVGWYDRNSDKKLHTVGEKEPNEWGLYDMHGNIFEWCQDWYDPEYYSKSSSKDPTGPKNGLQRVLRGGSWKGVAQGCQSFSRNEDTPVKRNEYAGFRLVYNPPKSL